MLSLLACYSMWPFIPISILAVSPASKRYVIYRRLPRLRPRIWIFATLIALLAIDFAVVNVTGMPFTHRVYVSDSTVVAVPLVVWFFTSPRVLDLWGLAMMIGVIGVVTMPAIEIP